MTGGYTDNTVWAKTLFIPIIGHRAVPEIRKVAERAGKRGGGADNSAPAAGAAGAVLEKV